MKIIVKAKPGVVLLVVNGAAVELCVDEAAELREGLRHATLHATDLPDAFKHFLTLENS